MLHVKNYETASKFVEVMRRKLWPLFFPDTVYICTSGTVRYCFFFNRTFNASREHKTKLNDIA